MTRRRHPSSHDATDTATLLGQCAKLEHLTLEHFVPRIWEWDVVANTNFISAFLGQTLPALSELDRRVLAVPVQDLTAFMKRHNQLVSAAFDHNCFRVLGQIDDSVNVRNEERVLQLLRDATRVPNVEVRPSTTCKWHIDYGGPVEDDS